MRPTLPLLALGLLAAASCLAQGYGTPSPKAGAASASAAPGIDPTHPIDYGTDRHTVDDFPAERRDLFWPMDQVADEQGKLQPLDFLPKNGTPEELAIGHDAIAGRNTWLMWCGGDEDFWDWLAQDAYGVLDFLQMLDSRKRGSRFHDLGLVNQPGMKSNPKPGPYGLYLDVVDKRIGEGIDPERDQALYPNPRPRKTDPDALESDGVDPRVYGYPSGVVGIRLFPNPNFDAAAKARWNAEAFYKDPVYATDPRTVRPFQVGVSCAICHIAAHPLNPPLNPEEPKWDNLSAIIGNQYFRTSGAFGSRVERGNFLWHYLASQQPGTIDTSMVSTDQINNSNAMNPVLELRGRLRRASLNPPEVQGPAAMTLPGEGNNPRLVPRVLMDGADSIGMFGALARVYLNIGTFHDEWDICTNPVIGFVPQKPFHIEVCRRNSVYWQVNEKYRVKYLAAFFTWEKRAHANAAIPGARLQSATAAMLLKDARVPSPDGGTVRFGDTDEGRRQLDGARAAKGSVVFVQNCMICHSSKQPDGFKIGFVSDPPKGTTWSQLPDNPEQLTLPLAGANWEEFKQSPAYKAYVARALVIAGNGDPEKLKAFEFENYFSTDLRIPASLTETYSGRALGTNAVEGQVWSDFTSETYKKLPAIGPITTYDPFSGKDLTFQPKGGGPGYYRVPSLVSIWATAPLLHNNTLGKYIPDYEEARRVSVAGRLEMFDDAIEKLLTRDKRSRSPSGEYGLRDAAGAIWHRGDPGWVFRTDMDTELRIPAKHIRHLVVGILPGFVPAKLTGMLLAFLDHPWILPLLIVVFSLVLALWLPRWYFYLLVLTGVLLVILFMATGIHYLLPWEIWLIPLALLAGGFFWILARPARRADPANVANSAEPSRTSAPSGTSQDSPHFLRKVVPFIAWSCIVAQGLLVIGLFVGLTAGRSFINGELSDLRVGPFPKGVPVNSLMNLDPEARTLDLLAVGRGLAHTFAILRADDLKPETARMNEQQRLAVFNEYAGPALIRASKCPDFVLDRGHYFGESLTPEEKADLIVFLKTL